MTSPTEERTLSQQPEPPLKKTPERSTLWIVQAVRLVFLLVISFMGRAGRGAARAHRVRDRGRACRVADAVIHDGDQSITGELTDGSGVPHDVPDEYADDLAALLKEAGVRTEVDPQKPNALLGTLITVILPVLLIGGILLFVMNRSQGGGGRGCSSVAASTRPSPRTSRRPRPTTWPVSTKPIESCRKSRTTCRTRLRPTTSEDPEGVLPSDRPAPARRCWRALSPARPACRSSRSRARTSWRCSGRGRPRVDLFEQAKASALPSSSSTRSTRSGVARAGLGGGHDEREQTLNQLLVEMDGFDQRTTVIRWRPRTVPTSSTGAAAAGAIRPSGRDRPPDLEGRKAILRSTPEAPFDGTVDPKYSLGARPDSPAPTSRTRSTRRRYAARRT